MYYQIFVDNKTKEIKGCEALVRWEHPVRGLVMPNDFIPYAESTDLIITIGYLIIERVFHDVSIFNEQIGNRSHYFSINLSARQLEDDKFVERVMSLLKQYKLDPNQIVFEITERVVLRNAEQTTIVFHELKKLGFRIALDDFGKGESSLSFLANFDVDILKIDASFIKNIDKDDKKRKMVAAVLSFCNEISIETVVEGVETINEVMYLFDQSCDTLQGYYYSKPLPYKDFEQLFFSNFDK